MLTWAKLSFASPEVMCMIPYHSLIVSPVLLILMAGPATTQPLAQHQWKHRVILLFAEAPDSSSIQEQLTVLRKQEEGLADRDLVLYRVGSEEGIKPSGKKLAEAEVDALRQKYASDHPGFRFVLIGKDGTEKWRTDKQATTEELFARIDRMPMRQAEMRREQNDKDGGG